MADPLTALLDKAPLTQSQRAGLWDLYQAAKDENDLDARLKSLQLPKTIKADLWDLKASTKTTEPPPTQKLSVLEMGRTRVTSDAPEEPNLIRRVVEAGQGMAHPTTGLDFLALGGLAKVPAVVNGVPAATQATMRTTGPVLAATGRGVSAVADSKTADVLSKTASAVEALFGNIGTGAVLYKAPRIASAVGRGVEAVGNAMSRGGATAVEESAPSVAQRLSQIPLKERLAQIPLQEVSDAWTAAKAAQPGSSLADDVLMVRGLVAKGFNPAVAVKVASGADTTYAESVAKAWTQSLKAKGAPIPESALAVSGKASPAVTELMNSPTFQALAQSLKARTP